MGKLFNRHSLVYEPSWQLLTELSREALLRLIRLPIDGASWEELQEVASICDDSALERVVMELRTLNLLRVSISPPELGGLGGAGSTLTSSIG